MTTQPPSPLQVTITQAAAMLSYSRKTIYTLLQRGEIRSVGTGQGRRIPVSELERWQKEQLSGKTTR